jgi:hypothetical protein
MGTVSQAGELPVAGEADRSESRPPLGFPTDGAGE